MLIIAVVLLPTTFMKEIAELHLVSMSLFGSALLFVVINVFQLILRRHELYSNIDEHYLKYLWPTFDG
jgi:amino acid permease